MPRKRPARNLALGMPRPLGLAQRPRPYRPGAIGLAHGRMQRPLRGMQAPKSQRPRQATAGQRMRKKASPKMLPARAEPIPANQRPWWLGVPLLGRLMAIIFPQQHLRAVKRTQFIGTRALSSVMMARLELSRHARRGARLSSNERARILRARSPGLTAAKGMQHARDGRIRGVLKYPQRRAA